MCQMGAMDIARHGYSARIILGHFFPDTVVATAETSVRKENRPNTPRIAAVPPPRTLAANAGTDVRAAP